MDQEFWIHGSGVLACADSQTAEWIQDMTSQIHMAEGLSLKALKRGDFGILRRISFYVPLDCRVPTEEVWDLIVQQNQLAIVVSTGD